MRRSAGKTVSGEMKIRETQLSQAQWREVVRNKPGEELLKNLAVASALVVCAVVLRSGAVPPLTSTTDAVLTAASGDTLLDDRLGKLTFVSALFPEATLVFGQNAGEPLVLPISGETVHAWCEAEPYVAYRGESTQVLAAAAGEVIGVYHGLEDERLVQVLRSDGLSCVYGNLSETTLSIGDSVAVGDAIGTLLPGKDCVLEVRQDGISVDPALLMGRT